LTAGEREEDVLEIGAARRDAVHAVAVGGEPRQERRCGAAEIGDADMQPRSVLDRPRHAGRRAERDEIDGTVDLAALGAVTGVARPIQEGARLHVGVAELGRTAPALLTWLAAHGHGVHRISSGRADLEDVFLSPTGRQLRD